MVEHCYLVGLLWFNVCHPAQSPPNDPFADSAPLQVPSRALNERGEINFNGAPLTQVMKFFRESYGIPIVLDDKALEDENIKPDEPVTMDLPAISFRSALKLILEPLQLTYVIEDEVMRITSKKTSANVVRVYPVGDLVVPIMQGGGMGGGMGGMMSVMDHPLKN